jgi:hypothetical protein
MSEDDPIWWIIWVGLGNGLYAFPNFYSDWLSWASARAESSEMLRFFGVVALINGKWLTERLGRHMEGDSPRRKRRWKR